MFALVTSGALLVVLGGTTKIFKPNESANALRTMKLGFNPFMVRLLAMFEVIIAVGFLIYSSRVFSGLLAGSFLCFSIFISVALYKKIPISSCGCFGEADSQPSRVHVLIDLMFTGVFTTQFFQGHNETLYRALQGQLEGGLTNLVQALVLCLLSYLVLSQLPRVRAYMG